MPIQYEGALYHAPDRRQSNSLKVSLGHDHQCLGAVGDLVGVGAILDRGKQGSGLLHRLRVVCADFERAPRAASRLAPWRARSGYQACWA